MPFSFTRRLGVGVVTVVCAAFAQTAAAEFEPPIAIRAGKVVRAPGETIENGVIIIRDGRIDDVGADVNIPANADVFDLPESTVYAGFIDALTHEGVDAKKPSESELRALRDEYPDTKETIQPGIPEGYRRAIRARWRVAEMYAPSDKQIEAHHKVGLTAALVSPESTIMAGNSAVYLLNNEPLRRRLLLQDFALHADLARGTRNTNSPNDMRYPATQAGAIALFRQTMHDARWQRDLEAWHARNALGDAPPFDRDLAALGPVLDRKRPVAFFANGENEILRALDLAAQTQVEPMVVGGHEAWKVADRLKREGVPLILSLKFGDKPEKPKSPIMDEEPQELPAWSSRAPTFDNGWHDRAFEPERVYDERLRLWHEKVDNAMRLHEAGIRFALSTYDLESPKELRKNLALAVERGLPEEAALAALTTDAARMLGLENMLGRIDDGRPANLTIIDGPLADKKKTKVRWVFVNGKPFQVDKPKPKVSKAASDDDGDEPKPTDRDPETWEEVVGDKDIDLNVMSLDDETAPEDEGHDAPEEEEDAERGSDDEDADEKDEKKKEPQIVWPTFASEIKADRKPAFQTGGDVLLRNATLLTIEDGDLEGTDVLIRGGRIAEIGQNIAKRDGVMEIDLTGYFISPGLIDAHSHLCINGGLNEWSLSVTPEVQLRDVIDHTPVGAYRAVAGGITAIHTMHGSANTIGGQNATLRVKVGKPVADWYFTQAPRTIKFALGENVKQSNSRNSGNRFPGTRSGVETVMRRAFHAARQYAQKQEAFRADKSNNNDPRPMRKDLRLEALCDVMDGNIWVHCHCYRADEILRLIDVAEDHGFRIAVLQHILEGYRIAPEIHRHGASGSSFSDWWAYKIEAFNAIPHNAARMVQNGIVTTVNSDSGEVIRHMNLEAAKSLRFGGLSTNDALRLVTLNAAIQLGVDKHVGSLKVGKFGDIAVFDAHPLDTFSKCVLTLIDGEVYFHHPKFNPDEPAKPRGARPFAPQRDLIDLPQQAAEEVWITGGRLHPISSEPRDGTLVMVDGKIHSMREAGATAPPNATVVDATGLNVYPGLINAGVALGLLEIESVAGTDDQRDTSRIRPDLRALSAYDPFSSHIGVARSEGVLAALVPPAGGFISGLAGLVRLHGWTMPEARLKADVGLVVDLPHRPREWPWWVRDEQKKEREKAYAGDLAEVETFFRDARLYAETTKLAAQDPSVLPYRDRMLEAMRPYVLGEKPIMFAANSYKEMLEVLRFAERYELKPVIFGGREAWKLADELAARNIDVIIQRSMAYPRGDYEPWDSVYANAKTLADAGVRFAFTTGEPSLAKQLGIEAGMAAAHGLSEDRALRALTLDAAGILGIDSELGSLDVGKRGDVIVCTDTPLQASNKVVAAFIDGQPLDLTNKHTDNDAKWLTRPTPELRPEAEELNGPPVMRLE